MCKWHKLAAKEAATNPVTGEFNVGQYAVALIAMGLFRMEQTQWQMPELMEIDGFNPEEILTHEARQAFKRSGLEKPLEAAKNDLDRHVADMRRGLAETARTINLDKDALDIKGNITKDGFKKTCCAPADPRDNGPFLDAAVVYLAKGYDDVERSRASDILSLVTSDELENMRTDNTVDIDSRQYIPLLEGLRSATEHFVNQPNMMKTLEGAFTNSINVIMQTAQRDLDLGLGLSGPSDCIMCEGAKGRKIQPTMV